MTLVLVVLAALAGFALGAALGPRLAQRLAGPEQEAPALPIPAGVETVPFDARVPRGTSTADYALHADHWRARMRAVGDRLRAADVGAIVFVHGTFTGNDPLSAVSLVERAVPRGARLARALRETTRATVSRVLGDFGTFGPPYVSLFEQALGGDFPCTEFVWSSENHHVGRLEGALSLVRALAVHATVAERKRARLLVFGHSHAAQLFALVTQLLSRTMGKEAFVDAARARGLDVGALDAELDVLSRAPLDFVTFGAPSRYAWAHVPRVRALHVLAAPRGGGFIPGGDWIARLGGSPSDFPALDPADRRANAVLEDALGPSLSPKDVVSALAATAKAPSAPSPGGLVLVDYGAAGLGERLASGFGHGAYTRLDGMLFHAELAVSRLYLPAPPTPPVPARGAAA